MIIPPYLKKNDTIGLLCPAGYMSLEKVNACIETLQRWGFRVKVGKTVGGGSSNYFSGPDNERLAELQDMMDDQNIRAILCARGGYGTGRIIEQVNFKKFTKHPKWIIGFSDITVLLSHLWSNYRIASLHAPMAAAFNDEPGSGNSEEDKNKYVQSLNYALTGEHSNYTAEGHPFNRGGSARGRLIGGNLSLLAHLTGTSSAINTKNKILFIEDIGEYIYNVDRMMHQLQRSGALHRLAGLIVGKFSDMKDTERPFGQTTEEVIRDRVSKYDYPVCFNFPVSHETENFALKVGVVHTLTVNGNVSLKESASSK